MRPMMAMIMSVGTPQASRCVQNECHDCHHHSKLHLDADAYAGCEHALVTAGRERCAPHGARSAAAREPSPSLYDSIAMRH